MQNLLSVFIILFNFVFVSCKDRPIIGILAQEFQAKDELNYLPAKSWINVAHVKCIEDSGGRAVPILINKKEEYYRKLLHSINGVIIPGGWAELKPGHGYYDALTIIYKIAKELNDGGIFFPILGVCLGFEGLIVVSNNHDDIQTTCNVIDEYYPLIFQSNFGQSLMFSKIPEDVYVALKYFDSTANFHVYCTTLKNFTEAGLDKEWNVLSVNNNRRGLKFISSMEHRKYPFLGIQYHPERHLSPWKSEQLSPYSRVAIKANRYFYDLLIDLAKQNDNKYASEKEEKKSLFINYSPIFWNRKKSLAQMYAF